MALQDAGMGWALVSGIAAGAVIARRAQCHLGLCGLRRCGRRRHGDNDEAQCKQRSQDGPNNAHSLHVEPVAPCSQFTALCVSGQVAGRRKMRSPWLPADIRGWSCPTPVALCREQYVRCWVLLLAGSSAQGGSVIECLSKAPQGMRRQALQLQCRWLHPPR